VSKVIRTVRMSDSVVTLGGAAGSLHLPEGDVAEQPVVDLRALLASRLEAALAVVTRDGEGRLQQEHETMRAASERQLEEADERHRAELEQVRQELYDEGHQAGVDAKEDEAREAVARLDALHESLKAVRRHVLMDAENLVVDLAVAVARRVTGIQVEMDPKVLMTTIHTALEHISDHSSLVIKVHPDDLNTARRFARRWVEKIDAEAVLRVVAGDTVERGGCMVEGQSENADARLEEQLDVLHTALREAVGAGASADDGSTVEEETP